MTPRCWLCGSSDVRVRFKEYAPTACKKGCTEDHSHEGSEAVTDMTCRRCGNAWEDGSGDFLPLAEGGLS